MGTIRLAAVHEAITPIVRSVTDNPRSNPRQLKPSQLLHLLNATPLGQVLNDRRLRKHRETAGLAIGDGKSIDLLRYAGWLAANRDRNVAADRSGAPPVEPSKDAYERKKATEAARNRAKAAKGKEIGSLPPIADPKRRAKALSGFRLFLLTYAVHVFGLKFSQAHEDAIDRFEDILNNGGQAALAMPRGFGKTSLMQWAILYAVLSGKRQYVVYVGAIADEAVDRLDEIKAELEVNELLAADFPEVCLPIRALEGIPQRANGQTIDGNRTHISWGGKRKIVLPTVEGSLSSGAVIAVRGIMGAMRGMKHTTADGRSIRPDLVVGDDPQTDASATNPAQVAKRMKVINGTMLQLAGGNVRIAAFVLVTVIAQDDLADQLLDRERNPQWRGQRTQALRSLPTNDTIWNQYAEAYAEGLRAEDGGKAANAFYKKHRKELEAGADVVWPERIKPGDLSALQSIMHVKIDSPEVFWAELQQQPLALQDATDEQITKAELVLRISQPPRLIVPQHTPRLICFIDPNSKVLWWGVCAFGNGFSGHLVASGTWPDQGLSYFANQDIRKTMAKAKPKVGLQARVMFGLEQLTSELLPTKFIDQAGDEHLIERCVIDANWGMITKTVYHFARSSPFAGIITPSHGKYFGPLDKTIEQWTRQDGDRVGHHWRERFNREHAKRFVVFDANRWKSLVSDRIRTAIGDPGAFTIYHDKPTHHRMLFDHLTSETPIEKTQKSQRLTVYEETKGRDNDLWDVIVGCHVGASMQGIQLEVSAGGKPPAPPTKRRKSSVTPLAI
jgi:hypothetical protein